MRYLLFFFFLSFVFIGCNTKKPTTKIDEIYNTSRLFYVSKNTPTVNFTKELRNLKLVSNTDSAKASVVIARWHMINSEWENAITEYKKAIYLLKNQLTDTVLIEAHVGIGSPYNQLGKYDLALENFYAAEKLVTPAHPAIFRGKIYGAIAQVLQVKGDLVGAKHYLQKSMPLIINNEASYYDSQLTLANVFGMSNQMDSALAVDNFNLQKLVGKNKPVYESYFYNNKANCYLYSNKFDSSEFYFLKCLAIDLAFNDKKQVADTYSCLMTLYATQNDSVKLNSITQKALDYSSSISFFTGKQLIFESLASYYTKRKEYKIALAYKDSLFVNYKQSLNEKTESKIEQLKLQFDTEKKEEEINQNNQQIKFQKAVIISIILLVIILLLYFYNFYKQSKLKRQEILNKAEQQQQDIANKTIFETEQKERTRIARDLHDSIGQMLAYIKLQNEQGDDAPISKAIDQTIHEVRRISHQLLPPELNFGLSKAIEALVSDLKISYQLSFNDEFVAFNFSDTVKITIYRIIQELINNTIKHANASTLFITAEKNNEHVKIDFLTNGNFIDEASLQTNTGIGWQNIKARLLLLNGQIKIENSTHKHGFVLTLHLSDATT